MTNTAPLPATTCSASRSLPLLIAGMSMMGPFCIDTYLPSFHEMELALHASPAPVSTMTRVASCVSRHVSASSIS